MNKGSMAALSAALDKIARGAMVPESLPEETSDLSEEQVQLIEIAQAVQGISTAPPEANLQANIRSRLLNRLPTLRSHPEQPETTSRSVWTSLWLKRVLVGLAIAVSTLVAGLLGSILIRNALPGDTLYPAKLVVEDFGLLVRSDSQDAQLLTRYASNRVSEIQLLIIRQRYDDIELAVLHYENDVNRTVLALAGVARHEPADPYPLVRQIEGELLVNAKTLRELEPIVPDAYAPLITQAVIGSFLW